ncbi:HD domain-containing protein [Patulibacter minatonensis]|uniref:HD domain-containing protein n=1 Tax=Patulibacter minatonensis TaxID=298163 RepID=UPI00047EB848|nr:HD domain-containing protein [Patulibacter minatonensis]
MTPTDADELCRTDAERACLAALRDGAGGVGSPMELHCVRQFVLCERLAGDRAFDRELLLCACWLHDAGLSTASDAPYVTEGALLVERVLEPFGWPAERLQRCMDACEQHHAPRSRMAMGLEVELVRRSDLIDVSAGIVAFGLERRWIRSLFARFPRTGFYPALAGLVVEELRTRPRSLWGVFVAPRRTLARQGGSTASR